ncbi:uncharacterized protein LOC112126613 [Cimex lectularius]|uniref:Uncharacterized protein n=1 Tax=Cimex lectularius TaxID=79782 RepID=A0A8I6SI84_CIMLE|nr:uncharacterized protein LOC112126613 [Cimex lectularius]
MNGRNSIKNRLVIIEYLECFAVVNCQMMMFDCLVTNELNISSYATVLVNCIGHILQAALNPLVGALADSLTGNLFWIVVGISLSISSNIFGILINFKAIPIYNRQILFYLALFLLISAKMTVGTRNALLFNYIITDTRSNIDQFIFMITMARNVTKAVASIIYCVNFYYRSGPVIFCCLGLLASVIGLIILLYSRNKIHIEPVEKGIFLKCIKWVFQRKKINDADQIFIIASKGKLVMNILLSSIGFYTSYHFLFQVLTHEFSLLTTNSQLTKRVLVFVFYTSNTILLIFVNHFFLNVYRKWKVDDVDLRLQGIAYNFMCIAMILLYLTLYRLRYASTAMIGEAQIRLYNGANETIRIKSSVSDIQINPGKLREIMHLPCTRECNVPIQIEFLHTKRIMDTEIKGEEVRSYTYIIKDNTMVKIERSDPVESPKGTSTFFVFANVDILQGLLIFDDEYPDEVKWRSKYEN